MSRSILITLVQESFLVGDIRANAEKIIRIAEQEKKRGVDLVVFPELALSGYPPEDLLLRAGFRNAIERAISEITAAIEGIQVVFGAPRSEQGRLYNSALWVADGQCRASFDKYDLPNYAVFDEKRYFMQGSTPTVVEIGGIHVGLGICEDIWTAQVARDAKQTGAQAMLVLNASPYHTGKFAERLDVLKQRHDETGMAIFYVNLTGGQDELVFDGESLVLDGKGQLAGRGPDFESARLSYRLFDNGEVQPVDTAFHEPHSDIANIYKALVTGCVIMSLTTGLMAWY